MEHAGADMISGEWTTVGLWLAVVVSGLYHGINPGMGWPLAVSAGLAQRNLSALASALGFVGAGHFLAMLMGLLPFALLATFFAWQMQVQIIASALLLLLGLFVLVARRKSSAGDHIPRMQLGMSSFCAAIAHGGGLMLVPVYLGLCGGALDKGHSAASTLIGTNLGMAILVSLTHCLAMMGSGGTMACLVWWCAGRKRSWRAIDPRLAWTVGILVAGTFSLGFAAALGR